MNKSPRPKGVFSLLVFFLSLSYHSLASSTQQEALPKIKLIDQSGKTFTLEKFRGDYLFISFVFTRCPMPEMCPLTMELTKKLILKWKKENHPKQMHFMAITLDPQFDTPAVIREYVTKHQINVPEFTFATGDEKSLNEFGSFFNIAAFPGGKFINHNIRSVLLSPDLKTIARFDDNQWNPEKVLTEILNWEKKTKAAQKAG